MYTCVCWCATCKWQQQQEAWTIRDIVLTPPLHLFHVHSIASMCVHVGHFLCTCADAQETVGDQQNRQSFNQAVSRRHFLTRGDINNICTTVNDRMIKRHKDDSTSATILVSELKEESFNPILLFKCQGNQNPEYPTLSADSFVLAIQTQFRMELYQQYASIILCIDSTQGTNQYRFKLITCIVPDDHGKGEDTSKET